MFKKIVIICICLFCLAALTAGVLLYVLNSPSLTAKMIYNRVRLDADGFTLDTIEIGKQRFRFPARLTLGDVRARVTAGDEEYEVTAGVLNVEAREIFSKRAEFSLGAEGVEVKSGSLKVRGLKADAVFSAGDGEGKTEGLNGLTGDFTLESVGFDGYTAENVKGRFKGAGESVVFEPVNADLYGGRARATAVIVCTGEPSYDMIVAIDRLDLKRLKEVNPVISENMSGLVTGELKVGGDLKGITALGGEVHAVGQGEIKAFLLKPLLDYIPQSVQKKEINLLIEKQGNILLDTARARVLSFEEDKISTRIDLTSKKFNLNISVTLDVNIEGGFKNLVQFNSDILK